MNAPQYYVIRTLTILFESRFTKLHNTMVQHIHYYHPQLLLFLHINTWVIVPNEVPYSVGLNNLVQINFPRDSCCFEF